MGREPAQNAYYFYDRVHSAVNKVVLVDPYKFAVIAKSKKKTDRHDAVTLARFLKLGAMMGLEGVVMKRKASIYRPGFRSADWLKVPIEHKEKFVIGGYLQGPRQWRTLILGQYYSNGHFVYAGFCGTGLSEETRAVIFEELKATRRKTCPFPTVPVLRDHFHELPHTPPEWVRPAVVVEVENRQRNGAVLRHAVLKGIRPDQPARQVVQSPQLRRGSF